ncbi:epoxyqueuosine reductase [Amylibacter marinus]|uniref:Epoxyqueuosine reductase n=1 Tax=Amylibacter marinus TaxID=1475483 RepID=A0ABQ5VWC3_9RHOB|nr:tRNA epoxyqueuosine(34) reductase QueG [Amylibacter marinus]GLQ35449.1 epoxyqueuosine reductase [Amylibacter marinus]
MALSGTDLKQALIQRAQLEGFSATAICSPDAAPGTMQKLQTFVDAGLHGQMQWMEQRMHWRGDASALWPEAKSVIMLAENYGPDYDPMQDLALDDRATISVYAQNKDYHDLVKKRLKRLGRWLIDAAGGAEIKVFVDTAPVMEKPLAQAAGLGWQGKHTNVVSRQLGSWFFLGSIFTTLDLPADGAEDDHCGNCRACLDACPTDAFIAPYQLDARKCISYLTIEYDGPVAPDLRAKMGNRIYGCDDCLAACPWNKFAQTAQEIGYHTRDGLRAPKLAELAQLDDASFRQKFSKNPIKRIGRNRFMRNVTYAIGNSGNLDLLPTAHQLAADADPVVRDGAIWAIEQLGKHQ